MGQRRNTDEESTDLTLRLAGRELIIHRRYVVLSILNDFLIALWFLMGSVLFLFPALKEAGAGLFVLGSVQFAARPSLRLLRHLHLRRVPSSRWDM